LGETTHRIKGLEAGADDYITKPFEPKELLLRIKSILKRTAVAEPALDLSPLTFGEYAFSRPTQELTHQGMPIALTTTEQQLLSLLATTPNIAVSREDIAKKLGLAATEGRAIDVHITRLRKKSPNLTRFLQTMRGQGYVLRV
jgi:two-component system phosphate regulon response regulator OmpR